MAGCFFELCFEPYALSDMMRTMYYPYHCRVLARRPKSCSNWRQLKSDLDKVPGSLKIIIFGPTLQRPSTLQRHGATLFAKIQQRRLRPCSSCCAVGKVCTLPIIIDSLDSITRLLRHRVCSLQSAAVLSQRLPLVTFIRRDVMPDASRGSLNLFRKNLMPVGLASIATHRMLNQCSDSSARQHSKCNSKCLELKKWMDDREFEIGAVFCLFCASLHKLCPFQRVQVWEIAGDCRCFGAGKTHCVPSFAKVRILLGICRRSLELNGLKESRDNRHINLRWKQSGSIRQPASSVSQQLLGLLRKHSKFPKGTFSRRMICAKSEVDNWHLGLVTKSKEAKRQV